MEKQEKKEKIKKDTAQILPKDGSGFRRAVDISCAR